MPIHLSLAFQRLVRPDNEVRTKPQVVLRLDHGGDDHVLALAPPEAFARSPVAALRPLLPFKVARRTAY